MQFSRFRPAMFVASSMLLASALSACSGDDSSPIDPASSAAPTADDAADEKAVVQLAENLWTAREEAGRESDPDRDRFADILLPQLLEREVTELSRYQDLGVTRKGGPVVTDVKATVDGDVATAAMCLDEDDWVSFEKGREIKGEDFGNGPFGFTARRTGEQWLIESFLDVDTSAKAQTC